MTKTISLESLGIHAPVPEKTEVDYKFCGEVPDLDLWKMKQELHTGVIKAVQEYLSAIRSDSEDRNKKAGLCTYSEIEYLATGEVKLRIRTAIKTNLPKELIPFVKGHEETHALEAICGNLQACDELCNAAKNCRLNTRIPIVCSESLADYGGIIALKRTSQDEADFAKSLKLAINSFGIFRRGAYKIA